MIHGIMAGGITDAPPGPYPLPTTAPFDSANLNYWFVPDRDVFTDIGKTTPAGNNDAIATWGTQGTEEDAVQNTGGNRPVYKTGGLNGSPYIECSGSQWFEDLVALTQPSGITNYTPFTLFLVTEGVTVGSPRSILAGSGLTRGGKGAFRFFDNGGTESYQMHHQNEIRAIVDSGGARSLSLPNIVMAGKRGSNLNAYQRKMNDMDTIEDTRGVNISPTSAVTNMQFLRGTGTGTGPFVGKLYEILIWHNTALSIANVSHVYEYLNWRYKVYTYDPVLIRGSGINTANATSLNVPIDASSQVGDTCFVFATGLAVAGSMALPSGWTNVLNSSATIWRGRIFSKVLDSTDISTGFVTITHASASQMVAASVTIEGSSFSIKEVIARNANVNTTTTRTLGPTEAVSPTDLVLYFGSRGANSDCNISLGTTLQDAQVASRSGRLNAYSPPMPGFVPATFTYTPASGGDYQGALVLRGAPI